MIYVPGEVYFFTGLISAEVVPSPKSHDEFAGGGTVVLLKLYSWFWHTLSGMSNWDAMVPMVIRFTFSIVSIQPSELVVIKVTEYEPGTEYV